MPEKMPNIRKRQVGTDLARREVYDILFKYS